MHRNKLFILSIVSILYFGVTITGCQTDSNNPTQIKDGGWAVIPTLSVTSNCASVATSPDVCTWANSVDAIAIVEIKKLEMAASPTVVADGSEHLIEQCDGIVNHYLKMNVSIRQMLKGNLPGDFTIRVGASQLDLWSPIPVKPLDEPMQWLGESENSGDILKVGQKVGVSLHYVADDDIWTLMGELMFSIQNDASDNEVVYFQNSISNDCYHQPPRNLQGADLENLEQALSTCSPEPSSEANARRQRVLAGWGSKPERYKSGVCIPFDVNDGNTECDLNDDCDAGQNCIDNQCVAL